MVLSLDHAFLEELNDYFGELCTDNTYMEPEPLKIENDHMIPEITVSQAWNSLQQRRKTATGPDDIQYTVWKDHGALLAPVITMVWNHPPTKSGSSKGKKTDYRGINVTSVIARAFEEIVLKKRNSVYV